MILTREVTDRIVGLIQDSIEIVKRGDFLRYYFVKTDTLVYTKAKEELYEVNLNKREEKYPSAASIWNRLDLTLHGLLGYYYVQEEESEMTNKIDIKCIKYEDEDEVIHKFEDKEWKDNKSYKFIKEKILSVLQDFRNIKINNENLKDLLKNALVEIKSASYYSFRIYPSKNPKSKYKSWIIANIEKGGISFKYNTVNILDYSDIEKDNHLYYLPIKKYNSDLYYLIPDLIKVFENITNINDEKELEELTEENGMKVIITEDNLIKALERADEYTKDYKGDFSLDKLEQKEINSKYQIILYYR